jgi:hypothetical protein
VKPLCLAVAAAAVLGCAHQRRVPFVESDYAPYAGAGTGAIAGAASMRTPEGLVKFGAVVHLNPVTPHSSEFYVEHIVAGRRISPPDPRTEAFHRQAFTDNQGRFRFDGLPPGEYFLHSRIEWYAPVRGMRPRGACVHAKVAVRDGEVAQAMLGEAGRGAAAR